MKRWMGCVLCCLLLIGARAGAEAAAPFVDKVVEHTVRMALRLALRLAPGEVLTEAMLEEVEHFGYDPRGMWYSEGHREAELADFDPAAYPQIGTLEDLRRMPNLMGVLIRHQPIDDISVLAELDKLESVRLDWCPNVTDLSAFAGKQGMVAVSLEGIPARDLTPVLTLEGLYTLYLSEVPYAADLSALAQASGLVFFAYTSEHPTPDLGALASHPNLGEVSVSGLDDAGLEKLLADVPGLGFLGLHGGGVTDAGMALLAGRPLHGMTLVDVPGVTRLDFVRGMPELGFVQLTGGPVRDLAPLTEGPEMYHLRLREVEGIDLSPVAKMTKLLTLEVPESEAWPLEAVREMVPWAEVFYGDPNVGWPPLDEEGKAR